MEGILVPINEKKSVRGMLSTREHISRSKTNDVSPFRKNISGVKDTRRAWRGEIRRGGEGGISRLASLSFIGDRFAVLKA